MFCKISKNLQEDTYNGELQVLTYARLKPTTLQSKGIHHKRLIVKFSEFLENIFSQRTPQRQLLTFTLLKRLVKECDLLIYRDGNLEYVTLIKRYF